MFDTASGMSIDRLAGRALYVVAELYLVRRIETETGRGRAVVMNFSCWTRCGKRQQNYMRMRGLSASAYVDASERRFQHVLIVIRCSKSWVGLVAMVDQRAGDDFGEIGFLHANLGQASWQTQPCAHGFDGIRNVCR